MNNSHILCSWFPYCPEQWCQRQHKHHEWHHPHYPLVHHFAPDPRPSLQLSEITPCFQRVTLIALTVSFFTARAIWAGTHWFCFFKATFSFFSDLTDSCIQVSLSQVFANLLLVSAKVLATSFSLDFNTAASACSFSFWTTAQPCFLCSLLNHLL